jgi:nucleoside-diphosphate-sugar epimerase
MAGAQRPEGEERALVTGANGFIGAALVERLLEAGVHVFAVTHRAQDNLLAIGGERLTILTADLSREDDIRAAVVRAQPTVAFHLAWLTEPGRYLTSIPWNLESVRFSLSLLECLLEHRCAHIVYAGSCAEYELGPAVLTEDSPARPSSVYGASKLALATAALAAAAEAGSALAWARIFYVYGPREDRRRAVPQIVDGAMSGRPPLLNKPDQARDFLHVDDVASALVALGRAPGHGTFNVCSGQGRTLRELWLRAQQMLGTDAPDLPMVPSNGGDEPPIVGDASRLRALGWTPGFGADAGLAEAVHWWREQVP